MPLPSTLQQAGHPASSVSLLCPASLMHGCTYPSCAFYSSCLFADQRMVVIVWEGGVGGDPILTFHFQDDRVL